MGCFSQIRYPVVQLVTVCVIDFKLRKLSVLNKPDQPVNAVATPVNFGYDITIMNETRD